MDVFSSNLGIWKNLNLINLQKTLDVVSVEIVNNQTASTKSRKELVNLTKETKQSENPDYKLLLKEYQKEIDSLNSRSKTAEQAFIDLYKKLAEIPDPCPIFESAITNLAKVEQNEFLTQENEELRVQVETLKEQTAKIPDLVKQSEYLSSEVERFQETTEQMVQDAVMQRTRELKEEHEDRLKSYKESETSLQKQLDFIQNEFKSLKNAQEYSQAQQIDNSLQDQEVAYKLAQLEIVTLDLDSLKQKLTLVNDENSKLRAQLSTKNDQDLNNHYQSQISQLEDMVKNLENELETKNQELVKRNEEWKVSLAEFNLMFEQNKTEMQVLKSQMEASSDYEIIKQEQNMFKMMENSRGDIEDGPLEYILLEKNKRLENELTGLKVRFG